MQNLIVKLGINAVALWAAANFVSGIQLGGSIAQILGVALIFGLVNALIRPVVKLLSFPLVFLTLGLITLVINGLMLMLTAQFTPYLTVSGLVPAVLGSLVISVVSTVLDSVLTKDDD